MADKYFGKGTASAVASGNMTPANPASLAVDDILICCIAQHDNVTATMPAGWTRIVAQNSTTAIRLDTFWRRVTSAGESSASVTVTRAAGDAGLAQITAFRGITTSGDPHNTSASLGNASSATVTMPTVTPSAAGQTIVFVGTVADDGAFGAVSGSDPAPTEREDSLTSLALDASLLIATGERSVSTATGNRTSTNVRTAVNCGAQIALTDASGSGPQTVDGGPGIASWVSSAATVLATVTITGVLAAATWTVPAPTIQITAAAPAAVASWAVPDATVQTSGAIAAPAAIATWLVPTGTVVPTVTVLAPVAVANWTSPDAAVLSPVTVQAPVSVSAWQVPAAQVQVGAIQAPAATASWAVPAPIVVPGVVTIASTSAISTWALPAATVVSGAVIVPASPASAAWAVPAAVATSGLTVAGPPGIASWIVPTVTVQKTLTPAAAVSAWTLPAASVIPGAVVVSAPFVSAAWVVPTATSEMIPTVLSDLVIVPAVGRWVVVPI